MDIDIILEKHGDAECTVSNAEEKGMCWIQLKEGNRDIQCLVSIDHLKLALRKISAK